MTWRSLLHESRGMIALVAIVLCVPVSVGVGTYLSSQRETLTFRVMESSAAIADKAEVTEAVCSAAVDRSQLTIHALRDSLSTVRRILKARSPR